MMTRKFGFCSPDDGWAKTDCEDFMSGGTPMRLKTVTNVKLTDKRCSFFIYLMYKSTIKMYFNNILNICEIYIEYINNS
jgi:hypothetical protein